MPDKSAPDKPWVMRTYAGHSSAAESNALYRKNLAKGQTGLSVAFDLPTQTGYDPDHELSRGEVGKVGVPIPHLGSMRRLLSTSPGPRCVSALGGFSTVMSWPPSCCCSFEIAFPFIGRTGLPVCARSGKRCMRGAGDLWR